MNLSLMIVTYEQQIRKQMNCYIIVFNSFIIIIIITIILLLFN